MPNFTFKADWQDPEHPRLIISSDDKQEIRQFFSVFVRLAKISGFHHVMNYTDQDEIIFNSSNGRGTPGVHKSDKDCLAINFLSAKVRDIFLAHFDGLCEAGTAPEYAAGTTTFYMHKEELVPFYQGRPDFEQRKEEYLRAARFMEPDTVATPLLGLANPDAFVIFTFKKLTNEDQYVDALTKIAEKSTYNTPSSYSWMGNGAMTILESQKTKPETKPVKEADDPNRCKFM